MSNRMKVSDLLWDRQCYSVNRFENMDGIYLSDSHGFVLNVKEMQELIEGLQITINNFSETEIDEHNKERHEEIMNKCSQDRIEAKQYISARKKKKGYVYIVTHDYINYKIGMTAKLNERITKLSIEMPYELNLIHHIETKDAWLTEKLFHEYFQEKRVNGEWFLLGAKDIEYFKNNKYTKEISSAIKGGAHNE